jgi:lipopolysaccharide/colanic/teichoic acid biosynthesis glycosyltransferase
MYKLTKRILDIFLAVLALVVLSPLILLAMIILLFTGEHEVFYVQQRLGYRNRTFSIWKFATMLKDSPNIGTGEITLRNDPRVTKFGRILRITKMNELPQVINVILGDMSIVGPRPLLSFSFKLYPDEVQKSLYSCRPGITGIGSLIFRDEEKIVSVSSNPSETYREIYKFKGQLENWYREHASIYTDAMIIFLTGWTLIFPHNQLVYRIFKNLPRRNF